MTLPTSAAEVEHAIDDAPDRFHPDNGDAGGRGAGGHPKRFWRLVPTAAIEITGEGLRPAQSGLSDKAPPNIKAAAAPSSAWQTPRNLGDHPSARGRRRLRRHCRRPARSARRRRLRLRQEQVQPCHPGLAPAGLGLQALHLFRRPRKGFASHGDQRRAAVLQRRRHRRPAWEPKNYDGKYDGPMTMRTGLARSKNMISIRVLQAVGPNGAGMDQPVWL